MNGTMTRVLIAGSILLVSTIFAGCIMDQENQKLNIEVFPKEYDGDFPSNPFKGFVAWGESPDLESYTQAWSMIYARLYWTQVEPQKGNFKWEEFESCWNFEKAQGNKKVVLRVVLDNPNEHFEDTTMEIPEWLYDKIDGKGTLYDNPDIGKGFSPDYTSSVLLSEHKRFIAALGKRYDNDQRVSFVQIGSIGHWGEWHTWPPGTGEFPKYGIAEKYIRHYLDAFKNKMLMVRRPLVMNASLAGLGLFNDALGDDSSSGGQSWLTWVEQGYKSEWDKAAHPPMRKSWWYSACSGGELAVHPDGTRHWFEDDQFEAMLDQLRESHTSWIGPNGPGNIENSRMYQARIDEMLATMGYRYVIEKASYRKYVAPGGRLDIELVVSNRGVAPIYYRWPLEISLVSLAKEIAYTAIAENVDIRTWIPGRHTVRISIRLPKDIQPMQYGLALSIANPDTGAPGIDFAIDQSLRLPNGRYVLGSFFVGKEIR